MSALGGTLVRGDDGWRWRDGAPEPRVRDLDASAHYNLRCSRRGAATVVEVPVGLAHEDSDLAWCRVYARGPDVDAGLRVREAAGSEDYRVGGRGAYLVPVEDWDAHWSFSGTIGAQWDRSDEAAILARARQLGWAP